MTRTYTKWQNDARNTIRNTKRDILKLGEELRENWDEWKHDAPYQSWEECCEAELGIKADSLRKARYRAKVSVDNVHTDKTDKTKGVDQKSYPTHRPDRTELTRRRDHVKNLWNQGYSEYKIADALGVGRGSIVTDVTSLGLRTQGRRPAHQKKRESPEGEFPWLNSELGITDEESTIEQPSFAACETPSATEAIEDVRIQLALITGGRYHLSIRDRNSLITVLTNALERLHNGNQETQETQDPSHRTRVAG